MKKANWGSNTTKVKIIVSLIIAFVLWIYVIGDQDPINSQKYSNIDVQMRNEYTLEEKELVLVDVLDATVDVTVEGRTSALYNLAWRNITTYVDLSEVTEKGSFDLSVEVLGLPESVDLISVSPATVTVEIDRLIQQNREIEIEFSGELDPGLELTDYIVNTGTVVIEGGEDVLATVQTVGAIVDLTGQDEGFSDVVALKAYDENGAEVQDVTLDPEEVTVSVAIGNNYSLPVVAVITGEPEEGYAIKDVQVTPVQVDVVSQGATEVTQIQTEPINIEGINEDGEITATLIFPAGMEPVSGSTTVQVKIEVETIETREFSVSTLEYRNRPETLQMASGQEDVPVVVQLSGPASVIEDITQNQILLYVDLSDGVAGENQVALQMESLEDITLISLEPSELIVTLEEVQE